LNDRRIAFSRIAYQTVARQQRHTEDGRSCTSSPGTACWMAKIIALAGFDEPANTSVTSAARTRLRRRKPGFFNKRAPDPAICGGLSFLFSFFQPFCPTPENSKRLNKKKNERKEYSKNEEIGICFGHYREKFSV